MIYLIRHAKKLDNSVDSKLSKEGLQNSFTYGKNLQVNNIKIDLIISSPMERCLQTAKEIVKGYEKNIKIEKSNLLGDPGIFVNNGDSAMKIFNKYKLVDIINMQLSGKELDGFSRIDTATQKLLLFMKNNQDNVLYISHDAIITPLVHFIGNINNIEENDIVDYLCGYSNFHKYLTKPWMINKLI